MDRTVRGRGEQQRLYLIIRGADCLLVTAMAAIGPCSVRFRRCHVCHAAISCTFEGYLGARAGHEQVGTETGKG